MSRKQGQRSPLENAVRQFWTTRERQLNRQVRSSKRDQGGRGAVTGGKQMNGFVELVAHQIVAAGIEPSSVHKYVSVELPGYFRPEKKWDLVVVDQGRLIAVLEFKSHVGPSFGNNFNNRTEEAIGSSHDLWEAYRNGAFPLGARPWLGYVLMLEDCPRSTSPVAVKEPHFGVFPEFAGASYARRYQLLMTKLVRERLYDSACFLMSARDSGKHGTYLEPDQDLAWTPFLNSLLGRIVSHRAGP